MKTKLLPALACFGVISGAQAAVISTTDSQTNGSSTLNHTYNPSGSDLINGLVPTTVGSGTWTNEGAGGDGTPAGYGVLNDGLFPSPMTRAPGPAWNNDPFATAGNGGGTSLTYTLTTPADIGQIDVYGGWQDGGRDQQNYSIFVSTSAAPATFTLLGSVDFNPADPSGQPQATKTSLLDDASPILAADVAAIRIDFNAVENGYTGYSEIDVIEAVPEPSSIGLLALSGLALLRRRR